MEKVRRKKENFFPPHPNKIVLKNNYYPQGLTEDDIYKYYMKNKDKILKEVENREVMFNIITDKGLVVKRKDSNGKFIKLNNSNYEDIITGRTISIHSTMHKTERIGIIDIDTEHFGFAKGSAAKIYDYLPDFEDIIAKQIRYTGKSSFHILVDFKSPKSINSIRSYLRKTLKNNFDTQFSIEQTRNSGKINLDLSPNKFRGGFITLYSLSSEGLMCLDIPRNKLLSFQKTTAKIK
jgi:hypothetical protein